MVACSWWDTRQGISPSLPLPWFCSTGSTGQSHLEKCFSTEYHLSLEPGDDECLPVGQTWAVSNRLEGKQTLEFNFLVF